MSCLPAWFDKKRGAAFGIAASGSSLGGIIFPIMVAKLIPQVGFAWTMRICAFLILGLLIIGNLTIRPRFPPNPKSMSRQDLIDPLTDIKFIFVCVGILFLTFGIFIPINYVTVEALSMGVASSLVSPRTCDFLCWFLCRIRTGNFVPHSYILSPEEVSSRGRRY